MDAMNKIKAIVKMPDENVGHMTWISDSLKNLQGIVDGHIEVLTLDNGVVLILNEEGLIRGLPHNINLGPHRNIVGTIIAVGASGEEFADVPIDMPQWKQLLKVWGNEL